MNKFKFTIEDLNRTVIEALNAKPEQGKGKPNLLKLLRAKKEQKNKWPLT